MTTEFIGIHFPEGMEYSTEERHCLNNILNQIESEFPNEKNLLVNLTWFGPQFDNGTWDCLLRLESNKIQFDNLFFLATVDPPYLNVIELQQVKNMVQALKVFYLGNFDSEYHFNFFAPIIAKKFKKYDDSQLVLDNLKYLFVNYNRKPRQHRVEFVKKLIDQDVSPLGVITLGTDATNDLLLTIGEKDEDYLDCGNSKMHWGKFGVPHDMFSLHRMDVWSQTFLYINAATEFDPINDLFCQQDTFKPMLGLRPFVINGVQRTYRWLRTHGFRTFNHYWPHIDIETGPVHDTIIELIKYLNSLSRSDLQEMYNQMLPDLYYNRQRFFEFANEQQYKMDNLFK